MSCHTWTYKKASSLTNDEKQKFVDEEIKDLENWWGFKKSIEDISSCFQKLLKEQSLVWEKEFNGRTPKQYAKDLVKEYTDKLNNLKEIGFDGYIQLQKDRCSSLIETCNDELYINIGFDDPCRVYGYREDKFTNLEEFIKFLKTTDSIMGYWDSDSNFIEGFSDELETHVRNYFEKHGKENLLIKFG